MLTKFLAAISLAVVSIAAPAPMAASANPLAPNGNLKLLTARSDLWDYQNDKIRGVNLGGWFVLEPYITPTLFQAFEDGSDQSNVPVDEYHYTQQLGKDLAFSRLDAHWNSWYIEDDFENMKSLGLNFVRIPIGYWAFKLLPNDPYVQGQIKYLDRALGWCRKYNLKAWVDLHGAPGSQNGFDNSGLRDHIEFQQGDNTDVTLEVLDLIVKKYGQSNWSDVVIGIELLNEPLGSELDMDKVKQFYYDGYDQLRKDGSYTPVIIHDAFQDFGYWNNELTVQNGDYWDVVVDHHHYQVFSPEQVSYDIGKHIQIACTWGWDAKKESHWNVAGEWSAALTDCALWLNGVGRGARWSGDYDNSPKYGSCAPYTDMKNWPSAYKTNVRKYIEAQLDAFEQTGGWVFWNWKTENAPEWDFQRLASSGYFPQPLNSRKYPNQCGFPN